MSSSEHLISMPEEDARHQKALHQLLFVRTNFQNKILCKRPVCCQLETEEYDKFTVLLDCDWCHLLFKFISFHSNRLGAELF